MKKLNRMVMALGVVLSLALYVPAVSAATPAATPAATNDATKQSTKTLAQRVEDYKTKNPVQLTAAQQTVLKGKCKAAQTITKALTVTVGTSSTNRTTVYGDITTTVEKIVGQLNDANVDTTKLTEQQTKVAELIKTYSTDVTSYKSVLTDLNEQDCTTDPVGFKATLEAARGQRTSVNKDVMAIRTYLQDTLKPSLKTAQASLTKATDTTKKAAQ